MRYVELETDIVKEAIGRIQQAGAVIRTQSPLLKHVNNSPRVWAEMWRRQVSLNCIPYYMFIFPGSKCLNIGIIRNK